MKIILYTDGGCSGNDQLDLSKRKMISVVANLAGDVLIDKHQQGGSNNIAELQAVKEALLWSINNNYSEVEIRTDSRNNFSWVFGKKVGKHINDRSSVLFLKTAIFAARSTLKDFKMTWVPREANVAGFYIEQKYQL